jgi:hypothetical protein
MASKYGLICTEEAVGQLWGGMSISEGKWILHQGLWVYKVTQSTELDPFNFPILDMVVICDNVSPYLLSIVLLELFCDIQKLSSSSTTSLPDKELGKTVAHLQKYFALKYSGTQDFLLKFNN